MKHPVVPTILFILVAVRNSLAIYCYDCNSFHDPACADPFKAKNVFLVNCNYDASTGYNATICRKLIQTIYHETRIIRSCGYLEQADPKKKNSCFRQTVTDATETIYCECDTESCNNSGRLKANVGLIAAVGLAVCWLRRTMN